MFCLSDKNGRLFTKPAGPEVGDMPVSGIGGTTTASEFEWRSYTEPRPTASQVANEVSGGVYPGGLSPGGVRGSQTAVGAMPERVTGRLNGSPKSR